MIWWTQLAAIITPGNLFTHQPVIVYNSTYTVCDCQKTRVSKFRSNGGLNLGVRLEIDATGLM